MFGLTTEKLILVALVAVIVLGPSRLPGYARRLAETARVLRSALETARERTEAETGLRWDPERMRSLDPRRLDPRSVIRDALADDPSTRRETPIDADPPEDVPSPERADDHHVPSYRYETQGSSAHPRRVRVPVVTDEEAGQPRPLSIPPAPVPMRTPVVPS